MASLYLIPVPIADSEKAALSYPRLTAIIAELTEFVVEDLRSARRALRNLGFEGDFDRCVFHLHNEHTGAKGLETIINSLKKGKDVGLISESGMPAVADPGSMVVAAAHEANIRVIPLPGPNSIILALAASGLNGQQFAFHGYLPKERKDRIKKLKELESRIKAGEGAQIFIETPYRNSHMLEDILQNCSSGIKLCVASDINGSNERIICKSITNWAANSFEMGEKVPSVFVLGS